MGLIAELLEYFRGEDGDAQVSEARGDLGGGDIVNAVDYQPPGFDAHPVPGVDYMLMVPGPEAGTFVVAGYVDPKNAGKAGPGEIRLYLRDGDGNVTGELYLADEEPDWVDTAGALIGRADRIEKRFSDFEEKYNSHTHETTGGTDGPPAEIAPTTDTFTGGPVGADKGWVT